MLALKLERVDEAIAELEMAARLAPDDQQAWSYLGYAYTKKGEPVPAGGRLSARAAGRARGGARERREDASVAHEPRHRGAARGRLAHAASGRRGAARDGTPIRGAR